MAEENDNMPAWRKKFLATRMTLESILFEREMLMPQKEKLGTGVLVLAGIWLFNSLLLAQWILRRGYSLAGEDAESFTAVLRFAEHFRSEGAWALIKPEFSGLTFNPPLYHLAFVPVLRYLTSDLNLALILVNSVFMLLLALSVFFAVRKSRPNRAGWLGAAFALALPFVLEAARRPSPEIALMALVAAVYACYILSEEFEQSRWAFWFGISLGLGFFCHRYFWLYVLPLVPFILTGLTSPLSREELFKALFPGFVLNVTWYLVAVVALAAGFAPFRGEALGFLDCLKAGAASAGLPLFALGALALAWMYFSVFMPYEKRKVVAALFWVPYLVLTFFLRGGHPELLYPAMLFPFSIALPVMTPHQARKYLLFFVLALGAVNQSGLVPPLSAGAYRLAGLPLPSGKTYRVSEVVELFRDSVPAGGGLVGVYGSGAGLNADSLRFAAAKAGCVAKFENNPACAACPSVLINVIPAPDARPLKSDSGFSSLSKEAWFPYNFAKSGELELGDSSKVEIYVKVRGRNMPFEEGSYNLRNLSFGSLRIEDATLKLSGYQQESCSYSKGSFFAPSALLAGGDIYGLAVEIGGLELAEAAPAPVPAGVKSLRITSAKISSYAIERYLAEKFPSLAELQVSLDNTLAVSALAGGYKLEAEFALSLPKAGVIEFKPSAFSLGYFSVPGYVLELFPFRLNFSDNAYGVTAAGVKVRGQMLEFY